MRELAVRLALLIGTNVHDCASLAAINDDSDSRGWALTRAFCPSILAFVQGIGSLRSSLPVRSRGDLNGLLALFHQGFNAHLDKRLDFRLVARRIGANRLVSDLRE